MGNRLKPVARHFGRRWPDWIALVLLIGLSASVIAWRNRRLSEAGGLEAVYLDSSGRRIATRAEPTVDVGDALPIQPADRVVWSGWVWVAETGKHVFGLHFKGKATLRVGERAIIESRTAARRARGHRSPKTHPRRLVKRQLLVEEGWHELELTYTPPSPNEAGIRLLWQPPGRRGPPEYVDPAYLRPPDTKPGEAGPKQLPWRDGLAASLLLVLLVGTVLFWLRAVLRRTAHRLATDSTARLDLAVSVGLLLLSAAIRLVDLNGAGQTWDEDVYFGAGRNYLQNLLGLDFRPASWVWNYEHPPVGKYLVGFGALWSETMTGPRAVTAIVGAIAPLAAYLAGRRLLGRPAAGVGGILAALSPHLIGHSKIGAFESLSVTLYTLSVLAFMCAEQTGRAPSPQKANPGTEPSPDPLDLEVRRIPPTRARTLAYLAAGALAGLAVSTRWLNFSVLIVLAVLFLARALPTVDRATGKLTLHGGALLVPVVAVAVPFLCWPRLWSHPVARIAETFGHYPEGLVIREMFLGQLRKPPATYHFVYMTAVVVSSTLVAWALFFPAWARRRARGQAYLFVWWIVCMVGGLAGPMIQDGARYVLPALIPFCLMAGGGAIFLADLLSRLTKKIVARTRLRDLAPKLEEHRGRLALLSLIGGAMAAISMHAAWQTHPYYIDYYNAFWGGPKNVARKGLLEISWWGEGLTSATRWINEHARSGSHVFLDVGARHVMVFRTDIRVTNRLETADLAVFAGDGLRRKKPAGLTLVHAERVDGAVLVAVYAKKKALTRP